jgi:hypothetical protein
MAKAMTRAWEGSLARSGRRRPIRSLAALCLLASAALLRGDPSPAAPGLGEPRQLRFEVSDYLDPGGGKWIRLLGEFECAYRAKLDRVLSILWAFSESPSVFTGIDSVRVRSDDGKRAVTELRTAVRILGFVFASGQVLNQSLSRPSPGSAAIEFEAIETDGSSLSTKGSWSLEERQDPSGPSTYVRYSLEAVVQPRFPGQLLIMRSFGAGDLKKVMRELGKAIDRS